MSEPAPEHSGRLRKLFGAGPLQLIATIASLAFAGFILLEVLDQSQPASFLVFFGGAIVAHDLVAFPLYSLLNLIAERGIGAHDGRPRRVTWLNHLRIPAALSGLTLLVWFPLILRRAERFESTTGESINGYMGRWLLLTAALFLASGIVYAVRLRRSRPAKET